MCHHTVDLDAVKGCPAGNCGQPHRRMRSRKTALAGKTPEAESTVGFALCPVSRILYCVLYKTLLLGEAGQRGARGSPVLFFATSCAFIIVSKLSN